jgi:HK97 family phage prohead protease
MSEAKQIVVGVTKAADSSYDGTFIISSTSRDRDGDNISLNALKNAAGNLKDDLICLWQHKSDAVCGAWKNVRLNGNTLIADLKIATGTNLGKMVKALLDADVPLRASIGFMGVGKYDEKNKGITWDEIELMETSLVSVPSNPEARRIAKSFGIEMEAIAEKNEADIVRRAKLALGDRSTVAIHRAKEALK